MYSVFAPVSASHVRRSLATNSGPLSERICSGTPFVTMTSASAPITFAELQRRSGRIIRHSRVLIDQIQDAHGPAVMRPCADELVAPYVAGVLRPEPYTRPIVQPQPAPRLLPLWYLEPFTTPDAFDPVFANPPACTLQQRRDPAVAIAAILAGKPDDGLGQCILVFARCRPVALRAAWLIDQSARPPFTCPMLGTSMRDRT